MFLILIFAPQNQAKTQSISSSTTAYTNLQTRSETAKYVEERLTPYLRNRIDRRHNKKHSPKNNLPPSETDLLLLAKVWNTLSTNFKNLYLQSVQIPADLISYTSPGGHFEILYSTSGSDSVAITDSIGFTSENWHLKSSSKNGIPDYVDETAFALDSSWAMIVERFGFPPPHVYQDSLYPSDKYKVVIEEQDEGYYGVTWLYEQVENGKTSYSSYISLRNTWNSPEWVEPGYSTNPVNGIRVTCSHEFFHTIQYSMSTTIKHAVWLDNFPLSWTEGSAASMEELAFDSINDYHQYASTYFNTPTMSFFDNTTSDVVYTNAILFLYIYQHNLSDSGIDFIKSMLFSSYDDATLPFYQNLLNSSSVNNGTWNAYLHAFHCSSFYTGENAKPSRFITDAPLLPKMRISPLSVIDTIRRILPANSGYYVRLIHNDKHSDTVSISIAASFSQTKYPIITTLPSYSILLKNKVTDTLFPLPSDGSGSSRFTLTTWNTGDTLTLITTNGNPVEQPEVTLFIQPYPLTYRKGTTVSDTVDDPKSIGSAILDITAEGDLHGPFSFSLATAPAGSTDDDQGFLPISTVYEATTPAFWHENASMRITVHPSTLPITADTVYLGAWDARSTSWKPLTSGVVPTSDTKSFASTITGSGMFALLRKNSRYIDTTEQLTIYPNPLSIKQHIDIFYFRGKNISRISIYRLDGTLMYKIIIPAEDSESNSQHHTYEWNIIQSGRVCSPGLYVAQIVQLSTAKKSSTITRRKLMVTP